MEEIAEAPEGDDFVAFQLAGAPAKGQYRCTECGYGITIHDELPTCPMCSGASWEETLWTPFGNARGVASGLGAAPL